MTTTEKRLPTEPPESYPLPWYVEDPGHAIQFYAANNKCFGHLTVGHEHQELAAYIVTAANGFPVLLAEVELLRKVTKVAGEVSARRANNREEFGSLEIDVCVLDDLEDALDKIGGGSEILRGGS